jgi:hypothetical protein
MGYLQVLADSRAVLQQSRGVTDQQGLQEGSREGLAAAGAGPSGRGRSRSITAQLRQRRRRHEQQQQQQDAQEEGTRAPAVSQGQRRTQQRPQQAAEQEDTGSPAARRGQRRSQQQQQQRAAEVGAHAPAASPGQRRTQQQQRQPRMPRASDVAKQLGRQVWNTLVTAHLAPTLADECASGMIGAASELDRCFVGSGGEGECGCGGSCSGMRTQLAWPAQLPLVNPNRVSFNSQRTELLLTWAEQQVERMAGDLRWPVLQLAATTAEFRVSDWSHF